jgi:transcriptional regulator with XRE-family HTH domain
MLPNVNRVAETLKALRDRRGLTQAELADKAELSRGYLIRLEQGKQDPTLGVLRRLAKALNVPLTRLVR